MHFSRSFLLFATTFFAVIFSFGKVATAQPMLELQKTDNPREYVLSLLEDISENGTSPLRVWLTDLSMGPAQIDSILPIFEAGLNTDEKHTIKIIEEIDNAGILRQVYAYTHFGHNSWMFWRIDFVKTGGEWTVSNFVFNSEYPTVIAREFETATIIE